MAQKSNYGILQVISGVFLAFCMGFLITRYLGDIVTTDLALAFLFFMISGPLTLLFSGFLFPAPSTMLIAAGLIALLSISWLFFRVWKSSDTTATFGRIFLGFLWGSCAIGPLVAFVPYFYI